MAHHEQKRKQILADLETRQIKEKQLIHKYELFQALHIEVRR